MSAGCWQQPAGACRGILQSCRSFLAQFISHTSDQNWWNYIAITVLVQSCIFGNCRMSMGHWRQPTGAFCGILQSGRPCLAQICGTTRSSALPENPRQCTAQQPAAMHHHTTHGYPLSRIDNPWQCTSRQPVGIHHLGLTTCGTPPRSLLLACDPRLFPVQD